MIQFIKSVHRSFKRARHSRVARPRLDELRPAVEAVCGGPVRFSPTDGGGRDFVFYVCQRDRRVAVLRIADTRHITDALPPAARCNGPRLRLTARERVLREHRLCALGAPFGLTPAPLWLSDDGDASLNSYCHGDRLLACVSKGRLSLWDAIDRTAERALEFHAAVGEAHMDLSLMNVIADPATDRLTLIDFELAPNPALSPEEARLFDFLNLVEMAYKFMSPAVRQEAPGRLARLFSQTVPADVRRASAAPLAAKLPRFLADPVFRDALAAHINL